MREVAFQSPKMNISRPAGRRGGRKEAAFCLASFLIVQSAIVLLVGTRARV